MEAIAWIRSPPIAQFKNFNLPHYPTCKDGVSFRDSQSGGDIKSKIVELGSKTKKGLHCIQLSAFGRVSQLPSVQVAGARPNWDEMGVHPRFSYQTVLGRDG